MILITFLVTSMLQAQPTTDQSNKHFWHSLDIDAAPKQIWEIWTDVPRWNNWDTGLKEAHMDSSFLLGARGTITSLEGRKSKFTIVELEEGVSYTFKSKLLLGSLYIKRFLREKETKTTITHEVWFAGPSKGIFAKAFGKKFRNMLPEVLNNIKEIAEHGSH